MEALLQVFVKVPDMEPIAIMVNPQMFTKHEINALIVLANRFKAEIPLVKGLHYKLDVVKQAMLKWENDHV